MTNERLRVGIVGLQPGRSWAARAHLPALRALEDRFEIAGVANSNRASSEAAAAASGIARAFSNVAALVSSPDVDVVAVTVRVPHHLEIVKAAIDAGKQVYCEWPLGNGLAEAEEMAALAKAKGVVGVVGTQARVAPQIQYVRQLVAKGFIGEVLSTTLVARGGGWGGVIPDKQNNAYLLDDSQGATMLTIPMGHALAALTETLGDLTTLSAVLATRRTTALVADSGERLPVTAPDQALVSGLMASCAPVSIHYQGGAPRDGRGFVWEIAGTKGDLRITAPLGHPQLMPLSLEAAIGDDKTYKAIEIPAALLAGYPIDAGAGNVARVYACLSRDVREGTRTAPRFDDAVAVHRVIAAIQQAAASGQRVLVSSVLPIA